MAINSELVAEKIFNQLRGKGFMVKSFNKTGDLVTNPQEATRFACAEPNILVRLDLNKESIGLSVSKDYDDDDLRKSLKELAQDNLLSFDFRVFNKKIEPKGEKIDIAKKAEKKMADVIGEASLGRMTGSSKTSYQPLENVKVVVRHKKAVNEEIRGSRSRNIHSIFVQRGEERFKMAENNLQMARAMARHLYSGGEVHDQIGESITKMAKDYRQLREFVSYVQKNKVINEGNQEIFELAVERVNEIRNTFKRLSGVKSYVTAVESLNEAPGSPVPLPSGGGSEEFVINSIDTLMKVLERLGLDKEALIRVHQHTLKVTWEKVKADPIGFVKSMYKVNPKATIALAGLFGLAGVGAEHMIRTTGRMLKRMFTPKKDRNEDIEHKFTESHLDDKVTKVIDVLEELIDKRNSFQDSIMMAIESEKFEGIKDLINEDDVVDFASPEAKLGYQVSQMGYTAKDSKLSNYLQNIGSKISNGGQLNPFEYRAVKASLLSAGQKDTSANPVDAGEQYESFLNQFVE